MRGALILVAVGVAIPLACGGDSGPDPNGSAGSGEGGQAYREPAGEGAAEPGKETEPEPSAEFGTVIKLADSQIGEALFDGDDQAIYLFDLEQTGKPQCYGECAAAWPPVLTGGRPVAAGVVEQDLLGTIERKDGSTQVTYAGQPLYYYAHEGPDELLCHNVEEFGGLWLALDQSGKPLG